MTGFTRRLIVTAGAILVLGTFMYFTNKTAGPILRLVVLLGGFGAMFILIKGYLLRA